MEYLIIKVDDLKSRIEDREDAKRTAFAQGNYSKFDHEYHTCLVLESMYQWAERVKIEGNKIIKE